MADALRTVYGHEAGMRRGCLLGVALGDDSALLRVKSLREAASRAMLEVSDAAGKDSMRLVTWNCAGKFREKFELVSRLEADLYVIQECEDPQVCRHERTGSSLLTACGRVRSRTRGSGFLRETVRRFRAWIGSRTACATFCRFG